jgi:NAD+ diphosphatase
MAFIPGFKPPTKPSKPALWFLFNDQRLLLKNINGSDHILQASDLENLGLIPIQQQYIGSLNGQPCYAAEIAPLDSIPAPYAFQKTRSLLGRAEDELARVAGLSEQMISWERSHRFCGRCGHPTENKTDERAKFCPECGLVNYPRLSPAVIVAVVKGNQILLARSQRFRPKFYSVLAGFVEPGETLEQCVRREVREEVGILVDNIHYFGSQPWPFPDSLMVGFIADYAGGTIKIDGFEILEAGWFSPDNLPSIPPKISIARHLIDWFLETKG